MRRGRRLRENPALQFLYDDLFVVGQRRICRDWPVFRLYSKLSQMNLCAFGALHGGAVSVRTKVGDYHDAPDETARLLRLVSPCVMAVEAVGGWNQHRLYSDEFDPDRHALGLWSASTAVALAR